jgi:hypothetical protein
MALAWVTRAVNDTQHDFTILQNDPSWHPIVGGRRFMQDEPITIGRSVNGMVTDFELRYCVVPWQAYGRMRLVGPNGKYIEYQVGNFVEDGKDHLRGVLSNGDIPLLVELGGEGSALWSSSYDFEIYVQQDQGVRWNVQGVWNSPLPPIVAAVGDALREMAPKLLTFLTA